MAECSECKWEDAGNPLRHASTCSRMPKCHCGKMAKGVDPDGSYTCYSCTFAPKSVPPPRRTSSAGALDHLRMFMIRFDIEIGDRETGALGKSLACIEVMAKNRNEAQVLFERAIGDAILKGWRDP